MSCRQNLRRNPDFYGRNPSPLALEAIRRGFFTRDDRVLELGCYSGRNTRYLARHVAQAIGIDHDPEIIRLAETRDPGSGAGFQVGDLKRLSFPPGTFTGIFSFLVLQLFEEAEIRKVIEDWGRVAIPGFRLALALPGKDNWPHPFFCGSRTFFDEALVAGLLRDFTFTLEHTVVEQPYGEETLAIPAILVWGTA